MTHENYSLSRAKNRSTRNVTTTPNEPLSNNAGGLLEQFDWRKLTRITAYVLRFINIAKGKTERNMGYLSSDEIIDGENVWLRYSQNLYFDKEVECLRQGKQLHRTSTLLKLSLFLATDRLSGRIKRSCMPYDTVHPIVLSNNCTTSRLLASQAHRRMLHAGVQATQQYLRHKYWIIGSRLLLKSIITNCIPCFRQRKENRQQLMGQLPESRVNPGRAFSSSAVDYAGPVNVKRFNAQRTKIIDKAYIAVFVCMRVKAVHLELVSDLTTEAFLAAFSRFSNRRGRIEELNSDNSTTFKGAENEQEKIYKT